MSESGKELIAYRAEIQAKLKIVEAAALPLDEVELRDQEEGELLNDFLLGKISLREFHERDPRGDTLYRNEIELRDISELSEILLMILGDPELVQELVDHESDHYEIAIRLGFPDTKILIRFFREGNETSLRPAIALQLPQSGDEEVIRRNVRLVIEAPKELSDLDNAQIGIAVKDKTPAKTER